MTPEQWQEIRPILESALELDLASRPTFLDEACTDPALRREVESLIVCHDQAGTGLLNSAVVPEEEARFRLLPGKRIGVYQILGEIALGGMGAVYRAVRADGQYKQQVALKIVRADLGAELTAVRFRNERQILASLDHPNIAKILDGGATADGLPYFVMEFIDGLQITDYCDRHKLTIDERLKIFRTVCSAVHYAHQHLVIHRDIKPSNILITSDGVPKLLDFGIAKIFDASMLAENATVTASGLWMMTPEYASPEQLRGEGITTATDVYSLGLVLYELLAGRRAYRFASHMPHEIARAVLETDPEKPSTAIRRKGKVGEQRQGKTVLTPEHVSDLRGNSPEKLHRRISGDLDHIVLKAIRKEPGARYASADQLSEDIRRQLEGLAILARKSTVAYRCRKFVLRHKLEAAAGALIFLSLLTGFALTLREARIARANELRAEERFKDVRKLANSLMFEIHDSIRNLPGATAARKLLTSRALQYLDSLAKEASGDNSLRRELATAYERVGDVQGKPRTPSLGDTKGALESYGKSLALRQALARNNPGDVQDVLGLAGISREISELLAVSGDVNGALDHANRAVAVAISISNTDAAGREARLTELLSDYIARGVIEYSSIPRGGLQRPEAALQDYQRGLETATELLKYNPNNRSAVHQKAVIYERRGRVLLLTGQPDAIQDLRVSLDIFRTLATDPNDAHAQRNLGASISMFADALSFDGRFREALAYYREELTIFQKLSNADPNDLNARMSVGGSYFDVGACLMRQGRLGEAFTLIQRARSVAEESVAIDPKSAVEWGALADCRIAEAETFGRMDQPSKALQSYRAARAIYSKLSRSDEHNVDARLMAAATDAKIAAILLRPGDLVPAREIFRQAVESSEPAANAVPPNQEAQYTLAAAYAGMGDIASRFAVRSPNTAQRTAHWTEATSWYEKSLRIWRAIPNCNRGFIDPNGFDAGDPEVVASALRRSTAALQQIAKPER